MKPKLHLIDPEEYFQEALSSLQRGDLEVADAEMDQLWHHHTVPEMHREYARLLEKEARRLSRKGKREEARQYREKARWAWVRSGSGMWTKKQADAVREEVRRMCEGWEKRIVAHESRWRPEHKRVLEASLRLDERRKQTRSTGIIVAQLVEEGRH